MDANDPSPKPLRIGLVGPGKIAARNLAPAIAAVRGAQLWSVMSREEGRAQAFAKHFEAKAPVAAFSDFDRMLEDPELDAVLIATPDRLHASQTIAAAKAGKHVLCEKPLATSVAEGEAMVEACRQANVRLGVAYNLRWHVGLRAWSQLLAKGALGELRHMRTHWTWHADDDSNWRAHSSTGRWWGFAGVGTHCLDMTRWLMMPTCGDLVRVQSLVTRKKFKGPHDETAMVLLEFESGATAEITTSVLFNSHSRFEIYGDRGWVHGSEVMRAHGGGRIEYCSDGGEPDPFVFTPEDPYAGEIADFVDAVRNNREPEVGGQEALHNIRWMAKAIPEVTT